MGRLGLGLAVILILIVVRTYPRVCPRQAHDVAAVAAKPRAAKPRPTRQSRRPRGFGLASRGPRGEAADLRARGKAAYNLVKYYLAFAFKLFYYVLFDL